MARTGGCLPLFLMAIAFDVLGFVLLFVGVFANVRVGDRYYGDFLIYTGSLVVFISLGFWVMWYVWNVPVSADGGVKRSDSAVARLARKFTERLSQKLRGEEKVRCVGVEDGSAPSKASRVTWGRSTAYSNEGYDGSLDSPTVGGEVEAEEEEGRM